MARPKTVPTDIDRHIGKTIQILRVRQGLSQKDLAKMVGITFQQVQKYESADNRIYASRLYDIARALTVPGRRDVQWYRQGYNI